MSSQASVGVEVLADLLLAAVEADRVEDAYALLADLVGEGPVRSAHGIALDRLADAVAAAAGTDLEGGGGPDPGAPRDETLDLLQAIRATTPARLPPERRSR